MSENEMLSRISTDCQTMYTISGSEEESEEKLLLQVSTNDKHIQFSFEDREVKLPKNKIESILHEYDELSEAHMFHFDMGDQKFTLIQLQY